jgi:hypothetical protein
MRTSAAEIASERRVVMADTFNERTQTLRHNSLDKAAQLQITTDRRDTQRLARCEMRNSGKKATPAAILVLCLRGEK